MKNVKTNRKLGNKGFSLVELIIVIAIMGVLMVVLVPNLTRYVENARMSTDDTLAGEVLRMVETLLIEDRDMFGDADAGVEKITISDDGVVFTSTTGFTPPTKLTDALKEMLKQDLDDIELSSNTYADMEYIITIDWDGTYPIATPPAAWTAVTGGGGGGG